MKQFIFTLILPIAFIVSSCNNDDGPTITDDQRQLIMGDDGDGVRLLGLNTPIVVERDDVHSWRHVWGDLDLNGDEDVVLLAYQDFGGSTATTNRGLVISTPNSSVNSEVLVDANGFVVPLNPGDAIKFDEGTWASVTEAPLAVYDNATTPNSTGLWNGASNKFVAFRMQDGNTRFLAWIELSVSDFDNHSFFNYGIKIVP